MTKQEHSIEISAVQDQEELKALADALRRSLWFPRLEEDDWTEREGVERLRIARLDGEVVGGLSCHHMGQWFGGRSVPMGAIRAVGIRPDARMYGVAHTMLTSNLAELREAGIPLASLYPATQRVYQSVGYGSAGTMVWYRQPISELHPAKRTDMRVRGLSGSMEMLREVLEPLYRARAERTNGHLERSDWMWDRCFLKPGGKQTRDVYVIERDGKAEGYVVCDHVRIPDQFRGRLEIRDWQATTPEAMRQIWCFVADHRSHMEFVRWHGPRAEPMLAMLDQHQWEIDVSLTWMTRIVDVVEALRKRGYSPALSMQVSLRVEDPCLPWNRGCWRLIVENGLASVTEATPDAKTVTLQVQGLSSLYTGYLSPYSLEQMGLLHGPSDALAELALLFAGGEPWTPDMF